MGLLGWDAGTERLWANCANFTWIEWQSTSTQSVMTPRQGAATVTLTRSLFRATTWRFRASSSPVASSATSPVRVGQVGDDDTEFDVS